MQTKIEEMWDKRNQISLQKLGKQLFLLVIVQKDKVVLLTSEETEQRDQHRHAKLQ